MNGLAVVIASDSFVAFLASAAVKGSLLLLAALLLDFVLRRYTAALRHRVWTAAFAALLIVPLAVPLAPDWSVPLLPARLAPSDAPQRGELDGAEPTIAVGRNEADAESASNEAGAMASNGDVALSVRASAIPWATLAIAAWGVGAILLLAQLGIAMGRASRLCRRARPLDDRAWNDLLERLSARLGLRAAVRLVQSEAVQSPMTWGVRGHQVVLPPGAERWSVERREVVLLHELAHIRRADCLAHLLSGLVVALYWPNPLVWIARRRQVVERELACDDTVVASGARGADYAWHLLEIARASGSCPRIAPAGVMMARQSQLEGRLLAALDGSRDRRHLSRFGSAVPTVTGVLMAVALAGLQPWATPVAQEAAAQGLPARERATQLFVGLLDDPDVSIRQQAVHSLGRIEDAAAVASLSEVMTNDDDAGVRAQAAWALGMIESPDAVAALGRALGDAEAQVRQQAAWALGMIESADAVAGLVTALRQDAVPSVRQQAAWALGMIEDEAGLEALIDAVEDENAAVRKQALWAVSMIVG